jgi:hypothetical protein
MEFDLDAALSPYGFVPVNKNVYISDVDTHYATIYECDCFYLIPIEGGEFILYQYGYYDAEGLFCHIPIPIYRFCLFLDFENDEEFIDELFLRLGIDKDLSMED